MKRADLALHSRRPCCPENGLLHGVHNCWNVGAERDDGITAPSRGSRSRAERHQERVPRLAVPRHLLEAHVDCPERIDFQF